MGSPIHTFEVEGILLAVLLYSDSGSPLLFAVKGCMCWSNENISTFPFKRSWSLGWFLSSRNGKQMNENSGGPCWTGRILIHLWPALDEKVMWALRQENNGNAHCNGLQCAHLMCLRGTESTFTQLKVYRMSTSEELPCGRCRRDHGELIDMLRRYLKLHRYCNTVITTLKFSKLTFNQIPNNVCWEFWTTLSC